MVFNEKQWGTTALSCDSQLVLSLSLSLSFSLSLFLSLSLFFFLSLSFSLSVPPSLPSPLSLPPSLSPFLPLPLSLPSPPSLVSLAKHGLQGHPLVAVNIKIRTKCKDRIFTINCAIVPLYVAVLLFPSSGLHVPWLALVLISLLGKG